MGDLDVFNVTFPTLNWPHLLKIFHKRGRIMRILNLLIQVGKKGKPGFAPVLKNRKLIFQSLFITGELHFKKRLGGLALRHNHVREETGKSSACYSKTDL